MRSRWITVGAILVAAGACAWLVEITRVFKAFQPIIVGLSIMTAAVFVRLNRGMPTLDWKSLEPKKRKRLTKDIVDLTREYAGIILLHALTIGLLVCIVVIGLTDLRAMQVVYKKLMSGAVGAMVTACVLRMAYVVWRDYDIVKLQKELIDATGDAEKLAEETGRAEEIVKGIQTSGIQPFPIEPPRKWPN